MRLVIVFFSLNSVSGTPVNIIYYIKKKHSWMVLVFQPVMTIISEREGKCLFLISIWLGHGKELVRIFLQVWFSSRLPSIVFTMCLGVPELWALAVWTLNCYSYVLVLRFLLRGFLSLWLIHTACGAWSLYNLEFVITKEKYFPNFMKTWPWKMGQRTKQTFLQGRHTDG